MERNHLRYSILAAGLLLALMAGLAAAQAPQAEPLGTAFTYQGRLTDGGGPANGSYDLQFKLYDAVDGGNLLGTVEPADVVVSGGLFTVMLDFGSSPFAGDARWLEIGVRPGDSQDPYTLLTPRQALTPSPYALYAAHAGDAWSLGGNAATTPGANYLGTSDNQALEIKVNGTRALRLEPRGGYAPNLIGGSAANWLTDGVIGAIIAGGGDGQTPNRVTDAYGTVGGGMDNQAGNDNGDVWDSYWATVGGGAVNRATGALSTIAGGYYNYATGAWSTVPGGWCNQAQGDYSFAAGRNAHALHDGSFVWADSEGSWFASSASNQFAVRATGGISLTVDTAGGGLRILPDPNSPSLIGGSSANWLAGGVYGATITGGGYDQSPNAVTDIYGTVGGGSGNMAGDNAGSVWSSRGDTVGGGEFNAAAGGYATIGGGESNSAAGTFATISGGWGNYAGDDWATVAGGNNNSAGSLYTTVGGGDGNTATDGYATVGGGRVNLASGQHATVAGGESNEASGNRAAVGGGLDNNATGAFTAIPGGSNNIAQGWYSFAAGRRAKANSDGCFAWGDSTDADVTCSNINRWVARASGGVWFYTNAAMTSGAYLAAGSGTWSALSDRNLKENVVGVDTQALLAGLAKVPVTTWNYISQDDSIRHIGPMAQDFYAAFGVGEDNTHITTVDADGIALAAIQALYAQNLELKAQLADLDARLAALEQSAGSSNSSKSGAGLPVPWLVAGGLVVVGAVRWWRGSIRHVSSGEARYFRDWPATEAFVEGLLRAADPQGIPGPHSGPVTGRRPNTI